MFVDPDRNTPNNEVSGVCQMTFHPAALRLETMSSQTFVSTTVGGDIASFPRGGLRPSNRDDWPTTVKNQSRISAKPQRIVTVSIHHRLSLVSVAHSGRAALYAHNSFLGSTVIFVLLTTCPHLPEICAALILRRFYGERIRILSTHWDLITFISDIARRMV